MSGCEHPDKVYSGEAQMTLQPRYAFVCRACKAVGWYAGPEPRLSFAPGFVAWKPRLEDVNLRLFAELTGSWEMLDLVERMRARKGKR